MTTFILFYIYPLLIRAINSINQGIGIVIGMVNIIIRTVVYIYRAKRENRSL